MDNSSAVAYINKQGGTRSCGLSLIAEDIITWCEERAISVSASYLPGSLNSIADEDSRSAHSDSSDWRLFPSIFGLISDVWPVEVDLFARSWNAQLPKFVSWSPQPGSLAVDAFSINWAEFLAYAFPPFAVIPRCLAKMRKEKADLVLICPVWPNQPWFPVLLEMACEPVRVLPIHPFLLTDSNRDPHPLVTSQSLRLSAWMLSGDASKSQDFRRKLSDFSLQATDPPQRPLISQHGRTGWIGVHRGVRIPCHQI